MRVLCVVHNLFVCMCDCPACCVCVLRNLCTVVVLSVFLVRLFMLYDVLSTVLCLCVCLSCVL